MVNKKSLLTKFMLVVLLVSTTHTQQAGFFNKHFNNVYKKIEASNNYVKSGILAISTFISYKTLIKPVCKTIFTVNRLRGIVKLTKFSLFAGTFVGAIYLYDKFLKKLEKERERKRKEKEEALKKECPICYEKKSSKDFIKLECGHEFCCKGCLENMVDIAIKDKSTDNMRCSDMSCKNKRGKRKKFSQKDIIKITDNNRDKLNAVNNIQTQEYLLVMSGLKHCPTPDCTYSFINDMGDAVARKCPLCNQTYCTNCLAQHDERISCEQAKEEREKVKNGEDAGTQNWLKENTKQCPHCGEGINKTDGCNHMTCGSCKNYFCWNCGQKVKKEYVLNKDGTAYMRSSCGCSL